MDVQTAANLIADNLAARTANLADPARSFYPLGPELWRARIARKIRRGEADIDERRDATRSALRAAWRDLQRAIEDVSSIYPWGFRLDGIDYLNSYYLRKGSRSLRFGDRSNGYGDGFAATTVERLRRCQIEYGQMRAACRVLRGQVAR